MEITSVKSRSRETQTIVESENDPLDFGDIRSIWSDSHDVGSGAWIMITKTIPVSEHARPRIYSIYWAIPYISGKKPRCDRFGRQAVKVLTAEEVTLFTDEFSVIAEDKLKIYRQEGWALTASNTKISVPLNLKIINQGRSLVEEEREILWALMVDGLSEQQACEEYFLTKHIDANNSNIIFTPSQVIIEELIQTFGDR